VTEGEESAEALRTQVRERYGAIGAQGSGCCGGDGGSSCNSAGGPGVHESCCSSAGSLGYSAKDLATLPPGADLGLGCGNPTGLAGLRAGEVVLDLGSGGGIDCFLAADRVGTEGRVIGVDMTPEMIARARSLADRSDRRNVEFRLGEIEHLPVADASVDVVLSNCVINLVPDKRQVYHEAYRVLRPGGRLSISDVVATRPIPPELRQDPARWASCSSGALSREEIVGCLEAAGFADIEVAVPPWPATPESLRAQADLGVVPGSIRARRPVHP
jgi:arsenite methyltransferase